MAISFSSSDDYQPGYRVLLAGVEDAEAVGSAADGDLSGVEVFGLNFGFARLSEAMVAELERLGATDVDHPAVQLCAAVALAGGMLVTQLARQGDLEMESVRTMLRNLGRAG